MKSSYRKSGLKPFCKYYLAPVKSKFVVSATKNLSKFILTFIHNFSLSFQLPNLNGPCYAKLNSSVTMLCGTYFLQETEGHSFVKSPKKGNNRIQTVSTFSQPSTERTY